MHKIKTLKYLLQFIYNYNLSMIDILLILFQKTDKINTTSKGQVVTISNGICFNTRFLALAFF